MIKIDVRQNADCTIRLCIDHNRDRRVVTLSVCAVEDTHDGFERINLSSFRFFTIEPAQRRNMKQISAAAERIRPNAERIAKCYQENDDIGIAMLVANV